MVRVKRKICKDKNITSYPTWERPDGARMDGEHPIEEWASFSGCTARWARRSLFANSDEHLFAGIAGSSKQNMYPIEFYNYWLSVGTIIIQVIGGWLFGCIFFA